MAKLIRGKSLRPDLILASPAVRALTTARIFAEKLDYEPSNIVTNELFYDGATLSIVDFLRGLENSLRVVMLFGHNPEITTLANFLTGAAIDNIPTCGIVCADFEVDSWNMIGNQNGKVRFFEKPKKYFN